MANNGDVTVSIFAQTIEKNAFLVPNLAVLSTPGRGPAYTLEHNRGRRCTTRLSMLILWLTPEEAACAHLLSMHLLSTDNSAA